MFGFIVGAACLFGLARLARGGCHGGGHRRWMTRALFHRLDTTPGQEKVILATMDRVHAAMLRAHQTLHGQRPSVAKAMRGEHFDGEAVRAATEQAQAAADEVRKAVTEGLSQVHEALTPEQRSRLADLIEFGGREGCGPSGRCGPRGRWHYGSAGAVHL